MGGILSPSLSVYSTVPEYVADEIEDVDVLSMTLTFVLSREASNGASNEPLLRNVTLWERARAYQKRKPRKGRGRVCMVMAYVIAASVGCASDLN